MSRSDRDLNQLFYDMANQATPPDAVADATRRRQRAIGGMRALHRRGVEEKQRAGRRRRRVLSSLIAAAAALLGTAFAAASGWLPFTFHDLFHRGAVAQSAPATSPLPQPRAVRGVKPEPVVPGVASPAAADAVAPLTPPSAQPRAYSADLERVNQMFADAKRARREHRDADELALLQQLLTEHPGSVLALEASVERFRALARLGRSAEAARYANAYLARYPNGYAAEEAQRIVSGAAP